MLSYNQMERQIDVINILMNKQYSDVWSETYEDLKPNYVPIT